MVIQDKAKPAGRQGRKATGLCKESRVTLHEVTRLFLCSLGIVVNQAILIKGDNYESTTKKNHVSC